MTKEANRGGPEEPREPFELPEALAEFLAGEELVMVTQATDQGAVFVVKAPGREIASLSGRVPMQVSHELHQHELAPVIRTVVKFYDRPDRPLALETFINIGEEQQWADYASLAEQDELLFLFYDETLTHRLTKRVRNTAGDQMRDTLNWADRVGATIPDNRYNFDAAKIDVMRTTSM